MSEKTYTAPQINRAKTAIAHIIGWADAQGHKDAATVLRHALDCLTVLPRNQKANRPRKKPRRRGTTR